jgi:hypothetical protein
MRRLWLGIRRAFARFCLRPLWRSLVVYGSIHTGPTVFREVAPTWPTTHVEAMFSRYTGGGPPPAHPERLITDQPLSEAEQRLVRELWPTYDPDAVRRIRRS